MDLQARLQELTDALTQAAQQYQLVFGRLEEVKYIIQQNDKIAADAIAAAQAEADAAAAAKEEPVT